MKSRELSRSKIGPFLLAYTDPYIDIEWEYQSSGRVGGWVGGWMDEHISITCIMFVCLDPFRFV